MIGTLKFLFSVLFVSSVFLTSSGCVQAQWFESPMVGQKAPGFVLETTKGNTVSFDDVAKGKKAILFFWSTWCPHCREQIEALAEKQDEFKTTGVELILVDIGEGKRQVDGFLKSKGLDFEVLLDLDGEVAGAYQVMGIPTIVLVSSGGIIRDVGHVFPTDYARLLK